MVIVESVALAIMVSNDIVMPLVLKRRAALAGEPSNAGAQLLTVRRIAIFAILFLAYIYYRSAGEAQLAAIGLLSFAAVAQLAPAFFGGLVWRRGTAPGAIAGMTAGILVWGYTLLLPSISEAGIVGARILTDGPFGLAMLRPQALFGLDLPPLVHGVAAQPSRSTLPAISAVRLRRAADARSSACRRICSCRRRCAANGAELPAAARFGHDRGTDRDRRPLSRRGAHAQIVRELRRVAPHQPRAAEPRPTSSLLQYGEYLLASAIGAASSRLVLSLLLRKRTVSTKAALKLLDDANAAIHYNREILQTALDHVRQGIAVFDKDLALVCWNRQFGEIFDLPHGLTRIGIALDEILRHIARHERRRARRRRIQVAATHSPNTRRRPSRFSNASPNAAW